MVNNLWYKQISSTYGDLILTCRFTERNGHHLSGLNFTLQFFSQQRNIQRWIVLHFLTLKQKVILIKRPVSTLYPCGEQAGRSSGPESKGRQRETENCTWTPLIVSHSADFSWFVSAGAAEWKERTRWGSVWIQVSTGQVENYSDQC